MKTPTYCIRPHIYYYSGDGVRRYVDVYKKTWWGWKKIGLFFSDEMAREQIAHWLRGEEMVTLETIQVSRFIKST